MTLILERLFWAGLGAAVAIAVALLVCQVRGLHPGIKVWICRLAMLKPLVACFSSVGVAIVDRSEPSRWLSGALPCFLLTVWMAGMLVVYCHAVRGYLAANRLWRSGQPLEFPELSLGTTARAVHGLSEPCIVGALRPRLLVPDDSAVDPHVMQHEIAHLRHLDAQFGLLSWTVMTLFWFVPGLGRLAAEHALWQEAAADLTARRALGTAPVDQARLLLAAASARPPVASPLLGFRGQSRLVARRIEAMFVPSHSALLAWLTLTLALCATVPLRGIEEHHGTVARGVFSPMAR